MELCPDGVEEVWISPARRTREAASLIKEVLLTGWDRVDARLGPGQGAARHIEIIERAQLNGLQSLLIVGHNPDLGEVALRCVGEREDAGTDATIRRQRRLSALPYCSTRPSR